MSPKNLASISNFFLSSSFQLCIQIYYILIYYDLIWFWDIFIFIINMMKSDNYDYFFVIMFSSLSNDLFSLSHQFYTFLTHMTWVNCQSLILLSKNISLKIKFSLDEEWYIESNMICKSIQNLFINSRYYLILKIFYI